MTSLIHNHDPTMTGVRWIAWVGCSLFITVIVQASLWYGYPLQELGQRPIQGRGLLEYLYYGSMKRRPIGVWGYDPIQGAFSPMLRVLCHCSLILILWGCSIYTYTSTIPSVATSDWNRDKVHLVIGGAVLCLYLLYCWMVFYVLPGVSIPPGPRPHRIQRIPQWYDQYWNISNPTTIRNPNTTKNSKPPTSSMILHRYVHGQESHIISEQIHNTDQETNKTNDSHSSPEFRLTGEPTGRDMWTTNTVMSTKVVSDIDEDLIQALASGGRPYAGFNPSINPNSADRVHREQMIRQYLAQPGNVPPAAVSSPTTSKNTSKIREATRRAVHFYSMLQTSDGHWSGDYGGPHFLLPGLIVVWYCMGKPQCTMLNVDDQQLMITYIKAHQQIDGGWGTHIESPSTMFGTTLMYVALRLLGLEADDPVCVNGRTFIKEQGGAVMTSSWAKFYLCILGTMHWDGHNSVPPEMWLLPKWFPFHPSRMWCHARMVYLPMGYLYGSRYVYHKSESDPLVKALREELYCEPYQHIKWDRTRHMVAPMDNYSPIPHIMRIAQNFLACYETWSIFQPMKNAIRKKGLTFCIDYMAAEDLQTNFIDIGPVNKVLNMLSAYHHAKCNISHPTVVKHMMRVPDYLWVAEDGMKMKGYNGSQCWDTSFAIQAIFEADLLDEFPLVSQKVWNYLERCQILSSEVSQSTPAYKYESAQYRCQYFRHISEGGWPFSTSAHGWPISDCTGEGLKGVLCLLKSKTVVEGIANKKLRPICVERLQKAANILLSYQNEDGGFATYENCRGFGWYESLNPSEVFGDIMIDYSYVECSMAALTGLVEFQKDFPDYRADEIRHSIANGRSFLRTLQRNDGSWYGSWACCFCYACWFGIEGLVKCGEPLNSECIVKACNYLIQQQRPNGGWGEDFTSCYDKEYASEGMKAYGDDGSGVVNTSWALLALSAAQYPDKVAIKRGVQYLMKRQLPCGDWPQEGIAGVFNRACGITYTAYRNVFPIWALGRCTTTYGDMLND